MGRHRRRFGGKVEDRVHTWSGKVLHGLLRSRGSSQSSFARDARELGYDYRQNSVSNWMRGVHAAPRELPRLLDRMYDLDSGEWLEVGVSFAYGQSASQEDLEDVGEFRQFYRQLLDAEKGDPGEVGSTAPSEGRRLE